MSLVLDETTTIAVESIEGAASFGIAIPDAAEESESSHVLEDSMDENDSDWI